MSSIQLNADTLAVTPSAGQVEFNGQFYGTDSNASRAQFERLVQSTAVASTSGTSITYTGIPSWAKRITVMFNGVSTSGTASIIVQVGSGSVTTTGYNSQASVVNTGVGTLNSTVGFLVIDGSQAAANYYGNATLTNITGNVWTETSIISQPNGTASVHSAAGSISLSGALDRVVVTTTNGTDTFDAGSINIMWEG
jgi:hypothetical protein